jgi:hypothetical protein
MAGDSTDVINSQTLVATVNAPFGLSSGAVGGMQLGPDSKIYISRGPARTLAIINNPNNTAATCNFVENAILLNGNIAYATGVPNSLARGTQNPPCTTAVNTTDIVAACNSYTWIDGVTYSTNNNTATDTLTSINGCDSIITLNLTINTATNGTDDRTTCGSFFWLDGNIYTSNNNTATHTIVNGNTNGCDSIVTLNLTVNSPSTGTDTVTACGPYTWLDGNIYTTDNTTAIYTLLNGNASGCDSLVILNLTINSVNNNNVNITTTVSNDSIWANALSATYQWLDCNNNNTFFTGQTNALYVAPTNGSYAVQVTQNGCIDTSACIVLTTVTIKENSFKNELLLYPNPTNGNFAIDLGDNYPSTIITITDVLGKQVQTNNYVNQQLLTLKLEQPAGVYFLTIVTENNTAVIRLIKE